jgi:hypothetical protein
VAIGGDVEGGMGVGEGAPEGALLTGASPAGLIDAEDGGVLDRLAQAGVGRSQGGGGPLADRLD